MINGEALLHSSFKLRTIPEAGGDGAFGAGEAQLGGDPFLAGIVIHQRDHRAAPARAGELRAERAFLQGCLDEPVKLRAGDADPPQEIAVGANRFRFIVGDTGIESPTLQVVEDVSAARDKDRARYDSYFWELGSMASVAR